MQHTLTFNPTVDLYETVVANVRAVFLQEKRALETTVESPLTIDPETPKQTTNWSTKTARRLLKELPPDAQRVLALLLVADPGTLTAADLAARINRESIAVKGVLGSFTKAIKRTRGLPKNERVFWKLGSYYMIDDPVRDVFLEVMAHDHHEMSLKQNYGLRTKLDHGLQSWHA